MQQFVCLKRRKLIHDRFFAGDVLQKHFQQENFQ